jgi:predicted nucleic acid-binding protein
VTSVVLDASAGVKVLLQGDEGVRVEAATAGSTLWVPEHFYVEVAATLRRLQLLGEITPERAAVAIDRCLQYPPVASRSCL